MALSNAAQGFAQKTEIRSTELLDTFERYASHIKVLSLDCFDTILWRTVAEPRDVFYHLEQRPAFKALDFTALTRMNAEQFAYSMNRLKSGTNQAKLKDIYRASFPQLNDEEVNTLAEEELAVEIETCFAFNPVVELMRKASARGIKMIIVSDTYLDEAQLTRLLASKLPADVMSAIAKIYCSCEKNRGKGEGLFQDIIAELNLLPAKILHLGDNFIADYLAPNALGVNTLRLVHHEDTVAELIRMQAVAASFIDPSIRNSRALVSPLKSFLSHQLITPTPESMIGYASVGPMMYAFARFVRSEVERLKTEGKRPKVLFLMRDGYLPALACEALAGEPMGIPIRISRFASYASAFRTEMDVDTYLATRIKSGRYRDICHQLLLPEDLSNEIAKKAEQSKTPAKEFSRLIHDPKILNITFQQSAIYRQRLIRHLQKTVGLEAGDTLVFVDLGYSGTAQNRLTPVFKEEIGVDIFGCYFIALRTPNWKASRRGLLDPSHYDDKTLAMFTAHIALIEQICTSTEKSVVDYDDEGNPIYSDTSVSEHQHDLSKPLHQECVRFIQEAEQYFPAARIQLTNDMLREMAAISLCRLIYLPTKPELEYLKGFHIDFNVGTDIILPIFDLEKGLTSLKRRSWLYSAKEHVKNMRLNYPAEWRAANLELVLTLMAQLRLGFEVAPNDLTQRTQTINVIAICHQQVLPFPLEATLTFDGYYSLLVPIVEGTDKVALCFGASYQWLELESAELITQKAIYTNLESEQTIDASPYLAGEQMADKGGGLFECLSADSLLVLTWPKHLQTQNYILRVIFRPIVARAKQITN